MGLVASKVKAAPLHRLLALRGTLAQSESLPGAGGGGEATWTSQATPKPRHKLPACSTSPME